jgi:hypothetical protein
MAFTSEEIKQASEAIEKLPPVQSLVNKYIVSDNFKHDLYRYKDIPHYVFLNGMEELCTDIIGEDMQLLLNKMYWASDAAGTSGNAFRNYLLKGAGMINDHFDKVVADYRLNDHFGKMFEVIGAKGARKVKNTEVNNAYVLKYDGYFQLSILIPPTEKRDLKAGDFQYVSTFDSLKEVALGMDYLMNLADERCRRELTEERERGRLLHTRVVPNKWFMNDDSFKAILEDVMKNVKPVLYSVVKRGYTNGWDSFQVVSDEKTETMSDVWTVITSGIRWDMAHEMQGRLSRVVTSRKTIDEHASKLERLQERIDITRRQLQESITENTKQYRYLDEFLRNKNIPEDVIIKLNESINPVNR